MKSDMLNMFATPLYRSSLDRRFSDSELAFFRESMQDPVKAIGNWSSRSKFLLNAPQLQEIREALQAHLDTFSNRI